jgi:hypothetical protein
MQLKELIANFTKFASEPILVLPINYAAGDGKVAEIASDTGKGLSLKGETVSFESDQCGMVHGLSRALWVASRVSLSLARPSLSARYPPPSSSLTQPATPV